MKQALPIVIAIVFLAGCIGDEGTTGQQVPPGSSSSQGASSTVSATVAPNDPAPSEDTGSIVVTVTDGELVPVASAQVEISGADLVAFSDEAGTATFNGLTPKSYTVLVAKPGYRPQLDKGKIVDVTAGAVSEVKLVLLPEEVIDASNSYHTVLPFKAFLACAIEGQPGTLGRTTPCGHWLNPGGQQVGDPNHKSRFIWTIDSTQITAIVIDAKWQPTTGVTAQQLRFIVTHVIECNATCLYQTTSLNIGGPSPIHGVLKQAPDNKITKRWGEDPTKYPRPAFYEAGAYCQTNCQGAQVVFQQSAEMWLTAFYGAEPADGYTALPK